MNRLTVIFLAFCAGMLVYLAAFVVYHFDPRFLILHLISGAFACGLGLGCAWFVGGMLQVYGLFGVWVACPRARKVFLGLNIIPIIYSLSLSYRAAVGDHVENGASRHVGFSNILILIGCTICVMFAIAHWPLKNQARPEPATPQPPPLPPMEQ